MYGISNFFILHHIRKLRRSLAKWVCQQCNQDSLQLRKPQCQSTITSHSQANDVTKQLNGNATGVVGVGGSMAAAEEVRAMAEVVAGAEVVVVGEVAAAE